MIGTQVRLSEQQRQALNTMPVQRKTSVAALMRQAVDLLLRSAGDADHEEQQRRALAVAGQTRSDVSDLALEHDHYLDEA